MNRFEPGRIVATSNALEILSNQDIEQAIRRHLSGDWGQVPPEDATSNELALKMGGRLLSAFRSRTGERFWIITEADRSLTTLLLPEDY